LPSYSRKRQKKSEKRFSGPTKVEEKQRATEENIFKVINSFALSLPPPIPNTRIKEKSSGISK
jgi:hypothetical protein